MSREDTLQRLFLLYTHLRKRVFDQYGIDITPEWENRVLSGEHDVPLPVNEQILGDEHGR